MQWDMFGILFSIIVSIIFMIWIAKGMSRNAKKYGSKRKSNQKTK